MPNAEQHSITVEAEGRSREIHMNSLNIPNDLRLEDCINLCSI